jgi:hypothetical protein
LIYRHKRYLSKGLSIDFSVEFVGLRGLFIRRRRANLRKDAVFGRYGGGLNDQSPPDRGRSTVAPASHVDYAAFKKGASTAESQLSLAHARRVHHLRRSLAMEESGLHMTRRWRETDSNPRSPIRRMSANTEIAADGEQLGADRRENAENADLAPLRDQRR